MNLSTALVVALLLTAAQMTVGGAGGGPEKQPPPAVAVQYKPAQEFVSLHEPIVVLFSVSNNLTKTITLTLGAQDIQFFDFALTSPTGQQIQEYWNMERDVDLVTIGSGKVEMRPGETYELPLLMNRWFHFDTPGTYFLTLRLTTHIGISDGSSINPQSETLRFTVQPRDRARLEKVCAALAKEVAAAANAAAAQEPARRLSYIDDPLAIPYLTRLLDYNKLTDHFVVAGLERIDTDDAVRALLAVLSSRQEDRERLSRGALMRMQERISDPTLKAAVKRALTATNPEPQGS